VQDLDRELSYAALIDEVARVAYGLRSRGVIEGDRVALLLPNSVDFVVAALAAMWVGAMFVPLAVTDPPSRLASIATDCETSLIVTSLQDGEVLQVGAITPVLITALDSGDTVREPVDERDSRVAYMIYTSGTTGTPKGVQISSGAFAAAVRSTANAVGLSPSTRTLCISPFHFDGSYANLFSTLTTGGTAVIRPRDSLLFPRTFFNTVKREEITYAGFTPSYLRLLLASPQVSALRGSSLETIALGGEVVLARDLETLWSHAPEMRAFNRYGPTETTIAVTNIELTPELIASGVVPIGLPHPGVFFALFDEDGQSVESTNVVGELYVGGNQLMVGYWANPQLSNEVMRSDLIPNQALYRTGDLAYRDEAGNYVYVDRADRVLKRHGVRISLVELSASLNKLDGIETAVCLTFDFEGDLGIVAFVTTRAEMSVLDLRRAASRLIPENMLPDRFERVVAMPLNKSNQLDERQLLLDAGLRPFRSASAAPS
jgi:D-alanine--poly(phosphoribitol) ligase subunit 1